MSDIPRKSRSDRRKARRTARRFVFTIVSSSIVLGTAIAASGTVWAGGLYKKIEAYFENVPVIVNGVKTEQSRDAIIYDGTVYLPVRSIAEALGGQVDWNGADRAVEIRFITNYTQALKDASVKGFYQFIAMRHTALTEEMLLVLGQKQPDADKLQSVVERYDELILSARNMRATGLETVLRKLKSAAELIRGGIGSGNYEDHLLAWSMYADLTDDLNAILSSNLR